MTREFNPPPIARQHCRHYSYSLGREHGPRCAAGVDLEAPGVTIRPCMPDPAFPCPNREEWTAEERAAWETYQAESQARMIAAMGVLPEVQPFSMVRLACPNCDGGTLKKSRTRRRIYVECSTPHCVKFEAQLAHPFGAA